MSTDTIIIVRTNVKTLIRRCDSQNSIFTKTTIENDGAGGTTAKNAAFRRKSTFRQMEFRGGRQPVSAAEKYGILGRLAPELDLNTWIDGDGDATAPIRLGDYRGSVVYLYFFQDWWPGYRKSGFPTL